jgi:hypothetical protein
MEFVDHLVHEELMRGAKAGTKRVAGQGKILDAIKGLHAPLLTKTDQCPPIPTSLSDRWKEVQRQDALEQERRKKAKKAKAGAAA